MDEQMRQIIVERDTLHKGQMKQKNSKPGKQNLQVSKRGRDRCGDCLELTRSGLANSFGRQAGGAGGRAASDGFDIEIQGTSRYIGHVRDMVGGLLGCSPGGRLAIPTGTGSLLGFLQAIDFAWGDFRIPLDWRCGSTVWNDLGIHLRLEVRVVDDLSGMGGGGVMGQLGGMKSLIPLLAYGNVGVREPGEHAVGSIGVQGEPEGGARVR